jgi:hypothetical protein
MSPRRAVAQISGSIHITKFKCLLRTTGMNHILERVWKMNSKIRNKEEVSIKLRNKEKKVKGHE